MHAATHRHFKRSKYFFEIKIFNEMAKWQCISSQYFYHNFVIQHFMFGNTTHELNYFQATIISHNKSHITPLK